MQFRISSIRPCNKERACLEALGLLWPQGSPAAFSHTRQNTRQNIVAITTWIWSLSCVQHRVPEPMGQRKESLNAGGKEKLGYTSLCAPPFRVWDSNVFESQPEQLFCSRSQFFTLACTFIECLVCLGREVLLLRWLLQPCLNLLLD